MENVMIKVYIKDTKNVLANAHITVDSDFGKITIKNFVIWKSPKHNERLQEYINIEPPTLRIYSRYQKLVFFEDVNMWIELERKIYDAYRIEQTKKGITEQVDSNDIPY